MQDKIDLYIQKSPENYKRPEYCFREIELCEQHYAKRKQIAKKVILMFSLNVNDRDMYEDANRNREEQEEQSEEQENHENLGDKEKF